MKNLYFILKKLDCYLYVFLSITAGHNMYGIIIFDDLRSVACSSHLLRVSANQLTNQVQDHNNHKHHTK